MAAEARDDERTAAVLWTDTECLLRQSWDVDATPSCRGYRGSRRRRGHTGPNYLTPALRPRYTDVLTRDYRM